MKYKKNLLVACLVGGLALGSTLVYAQTQSSTSLPIAQEAPVAPYDLDNNHIEDDRLLLFTTFRGTVAQILEPTTNEDGENVYTLVLESEESGTAYVYLTENDVIIKGLALVEDTKLVSIGDISVGDKLVLHFEASRPSLLIYPQRISDVSTVFIVGDEHPVNIHVDVYVYTSFMENQIVSLDDLFRLPKTTENITAEDNILVVDRNNEVFEGSLENKKLAVIYGITTRERIPMLLNSKVIVLGEAEDVAGFEDLNEDGQQEKQIINMLDFLPPAARGNSR